MIRTVKIIFCFFAFIFSLKILAGSTTIYQGCNFYGGVSINVRSDWDVKKHCKPWDSGNYYLHKYKSWPADSIIVYNSLPDDCDLHIYGWGLGKSYKIPNNSTVTIVDSESGLMHCTVCIGEPSQNSNGCQVGGGW